MTQPVPNNGYSVATGTSSNNVFITILLPVSPTINDINYPITKRWVNTNTGTEYILANFYAQDGAKYANWIQLGTGGGVVFPPIYDTLASTGNSLHGIAPGDPGQVLTSNGNSEYPSYQPIPSAVGALVGDTGTDTTASIISVEAGLSSKNCGTSVEFVSSSSEVLLNVTDSAQNTIIGKLSGPTASGSYEENVSLGYKNLTNIDSASGNIAIGTYIGGTLSSGGNNILMGYTAGMNYTADESSNILLNSSGVVGDNNTLRIGQDNGILERELSKVFIYGINGNTTDSPVPLTIDSVTNQLGTGASAYFSSVAITTLYGAGTYFTPGGVKWIVVQGVAPGGGGGAAVPTPGPGMQGSAGAGGGAGGYFISSFGPGVYEYSTGAGGAGGIPSSGSGSTGENIFFSTSSANGGIGGAATTESNIVATAAGGTGGAGTAGDFYAAGQSGQNAFVIGIGGVPSILSYAGSGGNSILAAGGQGYCNDSSLGNNGIYGSGGAGGCSLDGELGFNGGNGGDGIIVITEFY